MQLEAATKAGVEPRGGGQKGTALSAFGKTHNENEKSKLEEGGNPPKLRRKVIFRAWFCVEGSGIRNAE